MDDTFFINRIKFYIFIILQVPATIISLLVFIFLMKHRNQLKTPQNQALFLLIIVVFIQLTIDLPMPIHFYYYGEVIPATSGYCTWWTFIEYSLNLTSELIMATFSIQRHILIFKSHLMNKRLNRYLLHYIPFAICIFYPLIIYTCLIIFFPCDGTQWIYSANVCGFQTCFMVYSQFFGIYDIFVHNNFPIHIIFLANMLLIIRVINEKRRLHRPITWKQHSRMALQLFAVSSVFFISWLPAVIVITTQLITSSNIFGDLVVYFIGDMIYGVPLLLPWVCLGLLPDCRKWIRNFRRNEITATNSIRPTFLT